MLLPHGSTIDYFPVAVHHVTGFTRLDVVIVLTMLAMFYFPVALHHMTWWMRLNFVLFQTGWQWSGCALLNSQGCKECTFDRTTRQVYIFLEYIGPH